MDEAAWKQIRLSLERPYKDDSGEPIPVLLDIMPDGQRVYEPKVNASKALGENLRRIFAERGLDFFDRTQGRKFTEESLQTEAGDTLDSPDSLYGDTNPPSMTAEELHKMRLEILPQLFISLGEMSHARDLLVSLLAASHHPFPEVSPTSSNLSASVVSRPPPIVSVQAFDSQLTIGSKDEALRKAASVFRLAANGMERRRIRDEKYWVDALRVRRGNWGLVPAPLPFGTMSGKGAEKTSKDFLISYGLEESPILYRRQALGRFANDATNNLVFLHRRHARIRVSVVVANGDGRPLCSYNAISDADPTDLEGALTGAQQEIVEQEIFSLLVQEAGNLPTASARVSESLVVIDAAENTELKFELSDMEVPRPKCSLLFEERCNLIYFALHVLLLRKHAFSKAQRLGASGTFRRSSLAEPSQPPSILQPIIDLLQYHVFCDRVKAEIDQVVSALSGIGIPSSIRFDPVGEPGGYLVQVLQLDGGEAIGGQAILRIDNRHIIRLTFLSPSALTAHLPQATLTISSLPQLCQLLSDEVERCLLHRICELGTEFCENVGGTWFVDLNRCVGRWEGCVLNFSILYGEHFAIYCSAFQLHKMTPKHGQIDRYTSNNGNLLCWAEKIIKSATSAC